MLSRGATHPSSRAGLIGERTQICQQRLFPRPSVPGYTACMRWGCVVLLVLRLGTGSAAWAEPPPGAHLNYELYAGGLLIAHVEASIGADPWSYRMKLAYQTTGVV